jgi:hypothetical protein
MCALRISVLPTGVSGMRFLGVVRARYERVSVTHGFPSLYYSGFPSLYYSSLSTNHSSIKTPLLTYIYVGTNL